MDNIYYLVLGLVAFFSILFLLPTEAKNIKKRFKREVTALTGSIDARIVRIQGKAVLIEELTTPIFLKEAAVVETKFTRCQNMRNVILDLVVTRGIGR